MINNRKSVHKEYEIKCAENTIINVLAKYNNYNLHTLSIGSDLLTVSQYKLHVNLEITSFQSIQQSSQEAQSKSHP